MSIQNEINRIRDAKNLLADKMAAAGYPVTRENKINELDQILNLDASVNLFDYFPYIENEGVKELLPYSVRFNNTLFNSSVTIGNDITDCSNMFYGCYNFNQPVVIPDSVINCYSMFHFCRNFNSPITIGNNVIQTAYMFYGCTNLNQNLIIPNSVLHSQYMFGMCNLIGQQTYITIPNSVLHSQYMFQNCSNFWSTVFVPYSVVNASNMFCNVNGFYGNIEIEHGFDGSMSNMIKIPSGYIFDGTVFIPNTITNSNYSGFFYGEGGPNAKIIFEDGFENLSYIFSNDSSRILNHSNALNNFYYPSGVKNMSYAFFNSRIWNYNVSNNLINIPNSVVDAHNMFDTCYFHGEINFYPQIHIWNNMNCFGMFYNSNECDLSIEFEDSPSDLQYMFYKSKNLHIKFSNGLPDNCANFQHMFEDMITNWYHINRGYGSVLEIDFPHKPKTPLNTDMMFNNCFSLYSNYYPNGIPNRLNYYIQNTIKVDIYNIPDGSNLYNMFYSNNSSYAKYVINLHNTIINTDCFKWISSGNGKQFHIFPPDAVTYETLRNTAFCYGSENTLANNASIYNNDAIGYETAYFNNLSLYLYNTKFR